MFFIKITFKINVITLVDIVTNHFDVLTLNMLYKTSPVTGWYKCLGRWDEKCYICEKLEFLVINHQASRKSSTILIAARYALVTISFLCLSKRPFSVMKRKKKKKKSYQSLSMHETNLSEQQPVFPHECPSNRIWTESPLRAAFRKIF